MKRCKKLLCLVLALVMALSLCTVAMADDPTGDVAGTMDDVTVEITLEGFYYGGVSSDCKVTSVKKIQGDTSTLIETVTAGSGSGYGAHLQYVAGASTSAENAWVGALAATNEGTGKYQLKVSFSSVDDIPTNKTGYTLKLQKYSSPGVAKMENGAPVYETIDASDYTSVNNQGQCAVVFDLTLTKENYTKYIPFTKVVELGGNTEPGAQRFELEWVNKPIDVTVIAPNGTQGIETSDSADKHVDVTGYVDTNGAGTYTGNICVTGPKYYVDCFVEQYEIYIREKNDGAAGWTYDNQMWLIKYDSVGTDGDALTFIKVNDTNYTCPQVHENVTDHFTAMTLTNTYTENVAAPTHETIRRQHTTPVAEPEAPATQPVASPKTGDMGVALYAAMAVSSVLGMGYVSKKKF